MHNGTLLAAITQEVLAYFAASDQPCDAITLDVIRDRSDDNRRVRRARKALCVVLLENVSMGIAEVAEYIDRDVQTVWWHKRDLGMLVTMGGQDAAEWARDLRNITGRLLKYGGFEDAAEGQNDDDTAPGSRASAPCDTSRFDRRNVPRATATFGRPWVEYEQASSGDCLSMVDRVQGRNRTRRDP